jgi:hypothetical protein
MKAYKMVRHTHSVSLSLSHTHISTLSHTYCTLPNRAELAKAFCMKAYEMDRRDEELYLVWPRVEAAMGEPDRCV